jgi:prepilin-type processing-associated H-X9-DG protein
MKLPALTYRELYVALGIVVTLAVAAMPAVVHSREARKVGSCANNMKQVGLAVKMFTSESRGSIMPPLSPFRNNWMIDGTTIFGEYLTDPSALVCPASPRKETSPFADHSGRFRPECVSSVSYLYTGYVLLDDAHAFALFEPYQRDPGPVIRRENVKLSLPPWGQTQQGGASQGMMPVLWDRVSVDEALMSHRQPVGANVLHMDGHVEFVKYSPQNPHGFFPVTLVSAQTYGASWPEMPPHCQSMR